MSSCRLLERSRNFILCRDVQRGGSPCHRVSCNPPTFYVVYIMTISHKILPRENSRLLNEPFASADYLYVSIEPEQLKLGETRD